MTDRILQLDFEKRSCAVIVGELVPTIEHYRSQGRTLADIYIALSEKQLLVLGARSSQMTLGTFKKVYYRQRKKDPSRRVVVPESTSPKRKDVLREKEFSSASDLSKLISEKVDTDVKDTDVKDTDVNLADESSIQSQTFEERLAAHQQLAASEFFN